ncbi:LZTFL1 [Mytilus coruscus]|uniref:Leucine zipper transcription factor-like protein 1 n=1 Tax=Mytilus coruscus TaxID=42192 RepID=A0A6J8CGM3_MYTCO|nr:LZTFL1 [Mytilus coruscus]
MDTKLGINEHHSAQILNFLRFSRYQRGQRLRAVEMCFEELKTSRLDETTYTIDEVTDMLDGLLAVVRGEVESELINTSHTNILCMRQMFQQAEKWHLKLAADISELENKDLLENIAEFEEENFRGTKRDTDLNSVLKNVKLVPLNETGGTSLLHMKIEELEQENYKLMNENMKAKEKLVSLGGQAAIQELASAVKSSGKVSESELEETREKMAKLELELEKSKKTSPSAGDMDNELVSTKHELLRIREMLEMAEKELEKKVSQTNPFKNLKKMLVSKNDQLKQLRRKLSKYESVEDED